MLQEDAETFERWGVDYVKLDGCYSHPNDMDSGYPDFGYWLNKVNSNGNWQFPSYGIRTQTNVNRMF